MLNLEREIAYDIAGENVDSNHDEDILQQETPLIETSAVTAVGVAMPEMLRTEKDYRGHRLQPDQGQPNDDMADDDVDDFLAAT